MRYGAPHRYLSGAGKLTLLQRRAVASLNDVPRQQRMQWEGRIGISHESLLADLVGRIPGRTSSSWLAGGWCAGEPSASWAGDLEPHGAVVAGAPLLGDPFDEQ